MEKIPVTSNGCICCSLREDFIRGIEKLALDGRFDLILVEASGVSSPANIADAFEDEGTKFPARLDAIVAVADVNRIHTEFFGCAGGAYFLKCRWKPGGRTAGGIPGASGRLG